MEAKRVDRRDGRYWFEMVSEKEITVDDVEAAQIKLGYHPLGYCGPLGIRFSKDPDGKSRAAWSCYDSCD